MQKSSSFKLEHFVSNNDKLPAVKTMDSFVSKSKRMIKLLSNSSSRFLICITANRCVVHYRCGYRKKGLKSIYTYLSQSLFLLLLLNQLNIFPSGSSLKDI